MNFRDLATTSVGNLLRMKLRTSLTISGVVIAVGAFIAMLSFGAGNQRYVSEQFEKLGLLHTMQAFPKEESKASDTVKPAVLDTKAIERIAQLPGVRLVFPFDAFTATVHCADSQSNMQVRALPLAVLKTKWFNRFSAGSPFDTDTAKEALVTTDFLEEFGIENIDSAIGKTLTVTYRKAIIDSGLAQLFPPDREYLKKRWIEVKFDSILDSTYFVQLVHTELKHAMGQFMDGLLNHREVICDTLTIRGVLNTRGPGGGTAADLMIPEGIARKFSGGIPIDDPTALMSMMSSGNLFGTDADAHSKTYSRVTIDVEPTASHQIIKDSIEAMGFRSFSFAEQFEEIKKFFVYFDLGLSVFGLVALFTASLGIINTLVMSVLERRKEIGVMKSLGADVRDIRNLFLTESGLIGFIGSVFGIILGWIASRIASFALQTYMKHEEIGQVELFMLPVWLILAGLALGTVVSILAGLYPASRAAKVDPVEALRSE